MFRLGQQVEPYAAIRLRIADAASSSISDIHYFPFAARTEEHPTRLVGTIDEIVDDARRLAALPGVLGLDLLAYRFSGDVEQLAARVVQSVNVPVLAAGISCANLFPSRSRTSFSCRA